MNEVKDVLQGLLKDAPPMSRSADEMLGTVRSARSRGRNLLVSGAAAFAVAAIAGSVVLVQGSGADPRVVLPTQQAGASEPAPANMAVPIPFRFAPAWIPPQWAEHGRMAWVGEGQTETGASRIWSATPVWSHGELKGNRFELSYRKASTGMEGGTPVDINGRPGILLWDEDKSTVDWQTDAETIVSLMQWGNRISQTDLLRIARSVGPDPAVMTVPLRVSPLPEGYTPIGLEFSGLSPASWQAFLYLSAPALPGPAPSGPKAKERAGNRMITVAAGSETSAPQGGQPTTVGGRPARYVVSSVAEGRLELRYLVVDLGNSLLLTVSSFDLGMEQLVQVAEDTTIDPAADLTWIGPR